MTQLPVIQILDRSASETDTERDCRIEIDCLLTAFELQFTSESGSNFAEAEGKLVAREFDANGCPKFSERQLIAASVGTANVECSAGNCSGGVKPRLTCAGTAQTPGDSWARENQRDIPIFIGSPFETSGGNNSDVATAEYRLDGVSSGASSE